MTEKTLKKLLNFAEIVMFTNSPFDTFMISNFCLGFFLLRHPAQGRKDALSRNDNKKIHPKTKNRSEKGNAPLMSRDE